MADKRMTEDEVVAKLETAASGRADVRRMDARPLDKGGPSLVMTLMLESKREGEG